MVDLEIIKKCLKIHDEMIESLNDEKQTYEKFKKEFEEIYEKNNSNKI